MSEGARGGNDADANGTTGRQDGERPVTSGVAYNCSGTQFQAFRVASSVTPKRFDRNVEM